MENESESKCYTVILAIHHQLEYQPLLWCNNVQLTLNIGYQSSNRYKYTYTFFVYGLAQYPTMLRT